MKPENDKDATKGDGLFERPEKYMSFIPSGSDKGFEDEDENREEYQDEFSSDDEDLNGTYADDRDEEITHVDHHEKGPGRFDQFNDEFIGDPLAGIKDFMSKKDEEDLPRQGNLEDEYSDEDPYKNLPGLRYDW